MEVLSRDRELTILVDSESQRDIEQNCRRYKRYPCKYRVEC